MGRPPGSAQPVGSLIRYAPECVTGWRSDMKRLWRIVLVGLAFFMVVSRKPISNPRSKSVV